MFVAKLLAFPLSLVISASAAGVDMDYEGEVDVFTGEPVYTSDSDEESSNQQSVVRVTDGVNYDYEQNMYIYTVPDSGGQNAFIALPDNIRLLARNKLETVIYRDEILSVVNVILEDEMRHGAVVGYGIGGFQICQHHAVHGGSNFVLYSILFTYVAINELFCCGFIFTMSD